MYNLIKESNCLPQQWLKRLNSLKGNVEDSNRQHSRLRILTLTEMEFDL